MGQGFLQRSGGGFDLRSQPRYGQLQELTEQIARSEKQTALDEGRLETGRAASICGPSCSRLCRAASRPFRFSFLSSPCLIRAISFWSRCWDLIAVSLRKWP